MIINMKTLAIIARKGGVGKTTLALHLAVEWTSTGRSVAVIDLDPQASAAGWADGRAAAGPAVIAAPPGRLMATLDAARKGGADICIIDTAPHADQPMLAAAKAADVVLIPSRPGILDLRAIGASVEIAELAGRRGRALIVVNAAPPSRGRQMNAADAATETYGLPVAETMIGQRIGFGDALATSQGIRETDPTGKGAREIKRLATEIEKLWV
jgi:chromosome partitioning protein